ncbi:F0F1 ATP synthase subunit delta [Planosporangium flavigriseum]|uniref:ATP synthase subunit delta n=1 Tax=Planosporangium flavigriseum TaxID=373681 RepID=A0A8J3PNS1_9ACTN|nr:F0F1 ATP synthase subunit delta [Planosporangium flavigriseum]NJC64255.1 F0F1 ATP synthase subunit delta [Planosporangium flavigriseum]GIG74261.1 ATP synthase subunit delta [Planosporangium flavigriseum]
MEPAAIREAYAPVQRQLDELAGGTDSARLREIADEILTVARLLSREPGLRRALADVSRPTVVRVDLLRRLLGGKVGNETLALLTDLVSGRWARPSELLNATERLGADLLLAAAEREGELAEVEDELFRFGQIVESNMRLGLALGDSTVEVERRAELVRSLLEGKAKPVTVRLAELALTGFGGRSLLTSLTRLVELAAARRGASVAYVVMASAPTEAEERTLADKLAQMYGRQVSLKVEVKPEVIGGVSVRVGSDLYDGTVQRRLAEARTTLAR